MWIGGVRVIILNEKQEILMLKQTHEGNDIWMVPGGAVEEGENSLEAAKREALEETGLDVEIKRLIWHVEEVTEQRGQRFVNFFLAEIKGGQMVCGKDPELSESEQVIKELRFMDRKELETLKVLYPEYLKDELWAFLTKRNKWGEDYDSYKVREKRR